MLQNIIMLCSFVKINTDTMIYRNNNMQHNLSLEDLSLCKTKKSKNNQLTFGIILAYFKGHTKFPSDKTNIISTQLVLGRRQVNELR